MIYDVQIVVKRFDSAKVPRIAVHASSGVLCFASSSSVTVCSFPPTVVRSLPLRHRRIQSNKPQPGPRGFRLGLGLRGGGGEVARGLVGAKLGKVRFLFFMLGLGGGVAIFPN